ncbi:GNAT family N-acetyltransferase [Nostoc sp. ChiQUE01b]|uniref:GNAT family N-acetyltransferase n=1 Tax=Nostoc sp. ChiQUE01b TaxID=3075376 RepID=UPI002AD41CB0|nr:GNAT family N-acetyltransferase [Nostoc sp. ChiQUE01b]MDZ8236943.1 GNAT family N-acetyltransferase [Nostoc sp. ChiQUE01a]MDZ8262671.1 GNAT family N-acetyltransferase [Nostoc sp. ChiQUE01b]MDZ8262703.1 GNAT family N-acetyltransferase [Nostoc sp. ChiQUE01b]
MLKIILVENEEHKSHIKNLFFDYFNETKLIFSQKYNINIDVNTFFEQYITQLDEFLLPSGRLLLGQYEEQIAGCACLRNINQDIGEIKRMYVKPQFRQKGIGRALLQAIINEATDIGYSKLRLDTAPYAKEAHALYRAFGFYNIEPYLEKTEIPLEYRANWIFMELILK